MKAKIINKQGQQGKEIEVPSVFSSKIREDIAQKYFESEKKMQPYGSYVFAGMEYSASGKLKHRRHEWKTTYGRGISRVPRKIFWRRGTQFYWRGATVASTVGGRKAHHPKQEHFRIKKKINKKEKEMAISSVLASTASLDRVSKRYKKLKEIKNLPLILSSDSLSLETKEFLSLLQKTLGENYSLAIKKKQKRAGKGKLRGRKYKKTAGLLLVIGNKEERKINGIDVRKVSELEISDLWPLGRLTIYTERAIKDLSKSTEEKNRQNKENLR